MSIGVCHASEFRASDCLYYSAIARTAVSYSLISFTERHFTRHSFAAGKGIPRFAPIPSPPPTKPSAYALASLLQNSSQIWCATAHCGGGRDKLFRFPAQTSLSLTINERAT